MSRDIGRDRLHVQDSLFINNWELDVCHGVHNIILLFYVYDLLVVVSNIQDINLIKWKLAKSFVIKDLSVAKQILGMRITRDMKTHKLTLS